MTNDQRPVCLSVAGLDVSGGAGVIADVQTFRAFGCYASAVVTSITFQNTTGVFGAEHMTGGSVRRQIEAVLDDLDVYAVKTGMLPTQEIVETLANIIDERQIKTVVVDPVLRSTSGYELVDQGVLRVLIDRVFPLATLVTPNIPEAEIITGVAIENEEDIRDAATIMREMGARNVLIKGGHFANAKYKIQSAESVDHLFIGDEHRTFSSEYIHTTATHGTGCVLSSAIAANLALGKELADAVAAAKEFVTNAIRTAPRLGRGNSPINI